MPAGDAWLHAEVVHVQRVGLIGPAAFGGDVQGVASGAGRVDTYPKKTWATW